MTTHPCEIDRIVPKYEPCKQLSIKKIITLDDLLEDVCMTQDMNIHLVEAGMTIHEVTICRQLFCYVARKKTNYSLKTIGGRIGRHYSTVIYSCQIIEDLLYVKDQRFMANWNRYLANSKLFTKYDF